MLKPSGTKADPATAGSALVLSSSGGDLGFFCSTLEVFSAASAAKSLLPNPAGSEPTQLLLGRLWSRWVRELIGGVLQFYGALALKSISKPSRTKAGPATAGSALVQLGSGIGVGLL